ncbi:MAG: TIGR04283 family arsenosugar biosynthesis glycosyltransferase, partial [Planctomycetota bacterium]
MGTIKCTPKIPARGHGTSCICTGERGHPDRTQARKRAGRKPPIKRGSNMDGQAQVGGMSSKECRFSVIIPVLNEREQINSVIAHIRDQKGSESCEVIVVDGDPQGGTIKVIQDKQAVCVVSEEGRGKQMNAGAAIARGEILIFLHADTRLPPDALNKISRVLKNEHYVGGAFDLGIDTDRPLLKYIAARARFRSRLNRIPYGDQAIFIRKSYFDEIGRFKEIPLMEDIDLMRRIKKDGRKIYILPDRVSTSARRWQREGV